MIERLEQEISALSVAVESLNRRDASNVRRFAELQVEIDRLKGAVPCPLRPSRPSSS